MRVDYGGWSFEHAMHYLAGRLTSKVGGFWPIGDVTTWRDKD